MSGLKEDSDLDMPIRDHRGGRYNLVVGRVMVLMDEQPDDQELERRGWERAEVAKRRAARARSRVKKAEEEAEAAGSERSERAHRHEIPVHEAGAELQEAAQREHEEHARPSPIGCRRAGLTARPLLTGEG